MPAISSQFDIWQAVEVAHVGKHNRQIARILDDAVNYLAMHGLEPYGLGNGPDGNVIARAVPFVTRNSSKRPAIVL